MHLLSTLGPLDLGFKLHTYYDYYDRTLKRPKLTSQKLNRLLVNYIENV